MAAFAVITEGLDPDALIDGVANGSSDTWVEYTFDDSFIFRFDQAYDVDEFRLWNDRGVSDSGIGDFTLRFKDASNTLIGSFSGTTAPAPSGNGPAQSFAIPMMTGATQVTLIVDNPHRGTSVQFREVEFETDTAVVVDGLSGWIESPAATHLLPGFRDFHQMRGIVWLRAPAFGDQIREPIASLDPCERSHDRVDVGDDRQTEYRTGSAQCAFG